MGDKFVNQNTGNYLNQRQKRHIVSLTIVGGVPTYRPTYEPKKARWLKIDGNSFSGGFKWTQRQSWLPYPLVSECVRNLRFDMILKYLLYDKFINEAITIKFFFSSNDIWDRRFVPRPFSYSYVVELYSFWPITIDW